MVRKIFKIVLSVAGVLLVIQSLYVTYRIAQVFIQEIRQTRDVSGTSVSKGIHEARVQFYLTLQGMENGYPISEEDLDGDGLTAGRSCQ